LRDWNDGQTPPAIHAIGRSFCCPALVRRTLRFKGRLKDESRFAAQRGASMATTQQYRMKAAEYAALAQTAQSPSEVREFRSLERNYKSLAANEEWLSDNDRPSTSPPHEIDHAVVEEEQILRSLGAAVIMRWSTLPRKIQRELFDYAGSITDLQESAELKGQIARFLHNHKGDARKASPGVDRQASTSMGKARVHRSGAFSNRSEGMTMKKMVPRRIRETESDGRGIKEGWYATNKTGQLCSGPFPNRGDCQAHINGVRTDIDAGQGVAPLD
jgi:hypothetical protein